MEITTKSKLKNTNSNEYKERIFKHLLSRIDSEGYNVEAETDKEKINFVFDCFNSEYDHEYNRKMYGSTQNMIESWLQGLPSCISIEFMNHNILELVKELHEVDTLSEAQEDIILKNYFSHIAHKLIQLRTKLNK